MGNFASSYPVARIADAPSSAGMRGGVSFRSFELINKETISKIAASHEVIRFTFALPDATSVLGLEQPTTHIKIRMPFHVSPSLPRARTFSLTSTADNVGRFHITVKIIPGGRVSSWLAAQPIGSLIPITKTLTKRLAAPLSSSGAAGRHLGLICYGIGVTECILTAKWALEAGQAVKLVYAIRAAADMLFVKELCALAAAYPTAAGNHGLDAGQNRGRFELHLLLSREEPSPAFTSSLRETVGDSEVEPGNGAVVVVGNFENSAPAVPSTMTLAAAESVDRHEPSVVKSYGTNEPSLKPAGIASNVHVRRGRVDEAQLDSIFTADASESRLWRNDNISAFMVVGSKIQKRSTYALLRKLGMKKQLLGRPVLWGCW